MCNELKDIVTRLNGYRDEGWVVISAEKLAGGGWRLELQPFEKEPEAEEQEATNENN